MGAMQRRKGATFEREVAHDLAAALGVKVTRNIGQSRDGGDDITVGPFRVECKRRKRLAVVEGWLAQAEASRDCEGQMPVVVARQDHGAALVVMRWSHWLAFVGAAIGVIAQQGKSTATEEAA